MLQYTNVLIHSSQSGHMLAYVLLIDWPVALLYITQYDVLSESLHTNYFVCGARQLPSVGIINDIHNYNDIAP